MGPPVTLSTRRLWTWLPPASFSALSVIALAFVPDGGSRIFYAVLSLMMGAWLWRSWRVGVEIADDAVVIRGQLRSHRLAWTDIRGAAVGPLRTMSPSQRVVPYVALTLALADGSTRQFEDVSAAASRASLVEHVVDEINLRLGGRL